MKSGRGSLNVNIRRIAADLGISPMTVYRVVNNSPLVSRETRAKVIDTLNRHGFYTHKTTKHIQILFDYTDHEYLSYYGHLLQSNISKLNYTCYSTCHRKNRKAFLDLAAVCDAAVFASIPDESLIDEVRRINPDLYTIALSTKCNTDVTISPDNIKGAELAAGHFFKHGHRKVAVHMPDIHATRMVRYKAFYAEMKFLAEDSQIMVIPQSRNVGTVPALKAFFDETPIMPTGILFLAGEFAECFRKELLLKEPERFRDISIMTFDRPEDLAFKEIHYDFDRIECISNHLLDWAEYYITNRPMMKKRSPIHTSIDVRLVVSGSVKQI